MRSTVAQILQAEADRLLKKSISDGLKKDDLTHLNALILTHKSFIGASDGEAEPTPEEQSTGALLEAIKDSEQES